MTARRQENQAQQNRKKKEKEKEKMLCNYDEDCLHNGTSQKFPALQFVK